MDENQVSQFCSYLVQSVAEFQELAQARMDLNNDPLSKKLWDDIEERKATITLLKTKGLPVNPQQETELTQKLKEMRGNPITYRYLKALNMAKKIAGKIGAQMKQEVGIEFTPRKGCP